MTSTGANVYCRKGSKTHTRQGDVTRSIFIGAAILGTIFFISCGGGDDNGVKPDTKPPTITNITPANGASYVRPSAVITATFSEEMQAGSINDSTFTVDGVIGTVNYSDKVATFTPDSALSLNTVYTATITTGVRDAAGNALQSSYIWDFTTALSMLTDGADFFPFADGDIWYYTTSSHDTIVRTVSGDTTINGLVCKRVLENDTTAEAWSIDSTGFYVHLLDKILWFDPPLKIPFDLAYDEPFNYSSLVYWTQNDTLYQSDISGILKFKGYMTFTVNAGRFDSTIQLSYITEGYSEYYARGVGLLYNGVYALDSAYVGGVWYRP